MITLQVTGEAPVEFDGTLMHDFSGETVHSCARNRYHTLKIFAHCEGGFVCALDWRSRWQGEQSTSKVEYFETAEELANWIHKIDPLEDLIGFPRGSHFSEKQARLERQILTDWKNMRGEVLAALNVKKRLNRGKPAHPLGPCENPGWSIPERVRSSVSQAAIAAGEKPSEIVTKILAAHLELPIV